MATYLLQDATEGQGREGPRPNRREGDDNTAPKNLSNLGQHWERRHNMSKNKGTRPGTGKVDMPTNSLKPVNYKGK